MTMYRDPETHAANPPETWTVVKAADRCWHVRDAQGTTLSYANRTRKAALAEIDGPLRRRYDEDARWYAGDTPAGWKSWAECKAERDRIAARQAERAALAADLDAARQAGVVAYNVGRPNVWHEDPAMRELIPARLRGMANTASLTEAFSAAWEDQAEHDRQLDAARTAPQAQADDFETFLDAEFAETPA